MEEENDDEENPALLLLILNIGELKKAQVLDQNTTWTNSDIPKKYIQLKQSDPVSNLIFI